MNPKTMTWRPLALAAVLACAGAPALAQERTPTEKTAEPTAQQTAQTAPSAKTDTVVVTGKRARRVSTGATGLALEIKDTPQSLSVIDQRAMVDYGLDGSNDVLELGTGLNVEQYETNRAVFNSRGFEVQLTQVDGLGVSNDWGTVVGQQDTYLFERIELVRGANGLLTGVGNASGTINYVRKRPKAVDGGEVGLTLGSWGKKRVTLDYNKVLTEDGNWAGRIVLAHDDKDSFRRALHDKRTSVSAIVEGQIGRDGVLTLGVGHADSRQRSPMWGSLILKYTDGSDAEFDTSASTSQDWTYWNTRQTSAFAEYSHRISDDWEAKVTLTQRRGDEATKLLYAYVSGFGTAINPDNTGLLGWPYRSVSSDSSSVLDANVNGRFQAWGQTHSLIAGLSHSRQQQDTDTFPVTDFALALPAFPYAGDVLAEPTWGTRTDATASRQTLTRLYAAARLGLTPELKAIVGANAIKLHREGTSRYGSGGAVADPDTNEVSPYVGLTYDLTPDALAYVSYSDIFQAQDQYDINGVPLAPMRGVNTEAGVKAEWLNKQLLTTFALFGAKQSGLATYAGVSGTGQYYYVPVDVESKGVEFEATGRISTDTTLTAGLTHMKLTGADGNDIYNWVPRTTFKVRAETRVPVLPALRVGATARWRSKASNSGGYVQEGYAVVDSFAAYDLSPKTTVRLNVNNLFDKKYVHGLAYGALYGAPRNVSLSLNYKI